MPSWWWGRSQATEKHESGSWSVLCRLFSLSRPVLPQHTITSLFTCMAAQQRPPLASELISQGSTAGTAGRFNALLRTHHGNTANGCQDDSWPQTLCINSVVQSLDVITQMPRKNRRKKYSLLLKKGGIIFINEGLVWTKESNKSS